MLDRNFRPVCLDDYIGQPELVQRLRVAIAAAKKRNEPVEHVCLHGPPGLGKTTIAHIIANEMGTKAILSNGIALAKPADAMSILLKLQTGDVLFIDEIHRLPALVCEYMYSAMEDFQIQMQLDEGREKTFTLNLKPFTLVGATTRAGTLPQPFRNRFGIEHHLEFYDDDNLVKILDRAAKKMDLKFVGERNDVLRLLASRARGTPRIALKLLRRVRDLMQVSYMAVDADMVEKAMDLEGIDSRGLDNLDRKYLSILEKVYNGGPVGVKAIASTLGEDEATLEEAVEPHLLRCGLISRTPRGRMMVS